MAHVRALARRPFPAPVASATTAWLSRLAPRSQTIYRHELARFLAWCGRRTPVAELHRRDITAYLATLTAAGLSPSSRALALAVLRSWLGALVDDELIAANPAARVRLPPVPRRPTGALTTSEVRRLLAAVLRDPGPPVVRARNHALVLLAVTLGLRISEILDLDLGDIIAEPRPALHVRLPKSRTLRTRALRPDVLEALGDYVHLRADGRRREPADDAPLFARHDHKWGGRLSRHTVAQVLRRAVRRAGLRTHVSPHVLRATYITLAAEQGIPLDAIQRSVGHSSLRTTARYIRAEVTYETDPTWRIHLGVGERGNISRCDGA